MLQLIKTLSTSIDNVGRRIVKFLRYGKSDTQTAEQIGPPGVDASPLKDMIAVYAPTSEKGGTVVIGYINKNQVAEPGEHRIFAVNDQGQVMASIYLKKSGVVVISGETLEVFGNTKTLVKFQELKSAFDQLKQDLNTHIQNWNTFATAYLPGGPSTVGTPPTATTSTQSSANVDNAEAENLKTG